LTTAQKPDKFKANYSHEFLLVFSMCVCGYPRAVLSLVKFNIILYSERILKIN